MLKTHEIIDEYKKKAEACADKAEKSSYYFKAGQFGDMDSIKKYASMVSADYGNVNSSLADKAVKKLKHAIPKFEKATTAEKKEHALKELLDMKVPYAYYLMGSYYVNEGSPEKGISYLDFASLNGEPSAADYAAACYSQISAVTKDIGDKRNLGFDLEKYFHYKFLEIAWTETPWQKAKNYYKYVTGYMYRYNYERAVTSLCGDLASMSVKATFGNPLHRYIKYSDFIPDDELNMIIYAWTQQYINDNSLGMYKVFKKRLENETDCGIPLDKKGKPMKNIKRVVFESGDVYEGQLNSDGNPDGCGIYIFADKDIYDGEFKNGLPDGRGTLMEYTDDIKDKKYGYVCYEGQFQSGKKNGEFTVCGRNLYSEKLVDDEIHFYKDDAEILFDENTSAPGDYDTDDIYEYDDDDLFDEIDGIVNVLINPNKYLTPQEKRIENSCMFVRKIIDTAEELLNTDRWMSAQIISRLLGIECDINDDWIFGEDYNDIISFADAAFERANVLLGLGCKYPERTVVPAANIACYIRMKYNDNHLFYTLVNLWVSISMPSAGALLWVKRIAENNDPDIISSDFGEKNYCLDVERYYMGSNCRLFDPYEPEWEFD